MSRAGEPFPAHLAGLLKGARAGLFLALLLYDEPSTTQQLHIASGYSIKTTRQGLAKLESQGLVRYDRARHVWKVMPGTPLLRELRNVLYANSSPAATGKQFPPQEPIYPPPTGISSGQSSFREKTASQEEIFTHGSGSESNPDVVKTAGIEGISSLADREYLPGQPIMTPKGVIIPSLTYHTTAPDPDQETAAYARAQDRRHRGKREPMALNDEQREIAQWLIRGGIGRNSPKMRALLAFDLNIYTVKAHVLERLARQEGAEGAGRPFSPGLLIRKLEDGDDPPPMRCEKCLRLPKAPGYCRCDFDEIMRR